MRAGTGSQAIARDPAKLDLRHKRLAAATGDVLDPAGIAGAVAGHDAVISAIGPSQEGGKRTGKYRTGTGRLVTGAQGESRISVEDCAVAMIDELEQAQHIRQRFTVAY